MSRYRLNVTFVKNRANRVLSKTAEYALRAVACLAGNGKKPASADFLAEKTKVPRRYLTRVLQDLVAADLARSRSGPGGGYELVSDLDELTILDVVNAVAPVERIRRCPLGLQSHTQLCPLHAELDRAYAATEAAFAGVSIGELLRSTSPIVPLCNVS
jgi:Rrf2 family nitric oxide-sensitive transcriptional repressor